MSVSATSPAKFAGINILNHLHDCLDRISDNESFTKIMNLFKQIQSRRLDTVSKLFILLEHHSLKRKLESIHPIDPKNKTEVSLQIGMIASSKFMIKPSYLDLVQLLAMTLDGKHPESFEFCKKELNEKFFRSKVIIEDFQLAGKTFIHFKPTSSFMHYDVKRWVTPFVDHEIPLAIDLSISKLDTETTEKFIEDFGPHVLAVRIQQRNCCLLEKLLSNCQNIQHIQIKSLDITSLRLGHLNEFSNLKSLYLLNLHNLETLSFLAPKNILEELYVADCPQLTTLPSLEIFKSLKVCKIHNCDLIDKTHLKNLIMDLFPHNTPTAIQLLKSSIIEQYGLGFFDLSAVPAEFYLKHLDLVIKKLFIGKTKHLTYPQVEPFLGHLHRFSSEQFSSLKKAFSPLETIVPSELFDSPHLLSTPFQLCEAEITQTAPQESVIALNEAHEAHLDQLLFLFDCINFNEPHRLGYINPETLKRDSSPVSHSEVREGMVNLIETVKQRKFPLIGVPPEREEREAWYNHLELVLKNCIQAIDDFQDSDEEALVKVSRELISLAISGLYCGTRMFNQAKESLTILRNTPILSPADGGVKVTIDDWIDHFKFEIAKEIALSLELGYGNEHHTCGYVIKSLLNADVKFSARSLEKVDLHDPVIDTYIGLNTLPQDVFNLFSKKVNPMSFLVAIKDHLVTTFDNYALFNSDCLDSLKAFAEQKILSSEDLEKVATLDPRWKHQFLKEKVIESGLMTEEYDEDTGNISRSITLGGVLALLELFGYISYPSSASSSTPVFSS